MINLLYLGNMCIGDVFFPGRIISIEFFKAFPCNALTYGREVTLSIVRKQCYYLLYYIRLVK